jgi:N-acetylhexosamine 1-kinase
MEELIKTIFIDAYGDKTILGFETIQSGLINSTYKIETNEGVFILQKMNQKVFPNTKELLNNKIKITCFLNDNGFATLRFIPNKNGQFYTEFEEEIWQVSTFIPSVTLDRIVSTEVASQVGAYLAKFHKALLDFPVSQLEYTIPDFHNSVKRFYDFEESIKQATHERATTAKDSIAFLKDNYKKIEKVAIAINTGVIPLRVVHNDTKVGNMLFDKNGSILTIIDFDTVMPGSIFHDIGDALRTGTNTANEEEKDLTKVCFDTKIYESFMKSYIQEASGFFSLEEAQNIQLSLPLILFEQACRFLGDYLNNDSYYTINYKEQNLVRAKTQIKLLKSVFLYLDIRDKN